MNIAAVSTTAGTSAGATIAIIIGIIALIAAYWSPTIIASLRHVPNIGSVAVINGLLGWTLVGWAVALSMAVRSIPVAPQYVVPPGFQPPAPGFGPAQPMPQFPQSPLQARDDTPNVGY